MLSVARDDLGSALHDTLRRAVAGDDAQCVKLAAARTSVAFHCGERDHVVVRFAHHAIEVSVDGGAAEIEIHLTDAQAERFRRGELNVPLEAAVGELVYRGPVREYLVVDAILRDRLRAAWGGA